MIARIVRKLKFLKDKLSIRSFESLNKILPVGALSEKTLMSQQENVRDAYQFYVKHISSPDMAISLEMAAVLAELTEGPPSLKLLDLGSGFSSYIFRRPQNGTRLIFSVDDDKQWLEKTRNYLQSQSFDSNNLLHLNDFINSKESDFDIVLLDLNFVEVRKDFIALAIERTRSGGLVIFDDVHKPDYLIDVLKQTKDSTVTLFDISPITTDSYGRYAIIGVKK